MAKRTAADFTARDCGQLAEVARRVYWVPGPVHAALEVIPPLAPRLRLAGSSGAMAAQAASVGSPRPTIVCACVRLLPRQEGA